MTIYVCIVFDCKILLGLNKLEARDKTKTKILVP